MDQADKRKVLEYLNQSSAAFNDMAQEVMQRVLSSQLPPELDPFKEAQPSIQALTSGVKLDVKKFLRHQFELLEQQQKLWQSTARELMGETAEPVVSEAQDDTRFRDADWVGNPALNYVKQAYLLNAEFMSQMVEAFEFEDSKVMDQVRFYTRQLVNSMSPTNYIFTNPEACKEILASEGESIARGMDNFIRDLKYSPTEAFKVNQVGIDAFTIGSDIAATPGKVIYRNPLMELIQYEATTQEQIKTPLLIVPPFINKYYILDINNQKSLVKWLVEQGYCVFIISWVNPDVEHQEVDFEDYIFDAVLQALDVVKDITGEDQCHAVGYCVGGTLLGVAEAYLQAQKIKRLKSLTLLTTLFDFSEPGEVGNFLGAQMLPLIEHNVQTKGYLDGRILALGFSLLRENNLFWSFFIENYLKGKDPMPFDILYWNSDSTNIPAKAYLYYLHNLYVQNRLSMGTPLSIKGVPIQLRAITTPSFVLAAMADHIVLWQAAYRSAKLLGGDVTFALTESGHVAGVVNPPDKNKYGHWLNVDFGKKPEAWLAGAKMTNGSWWLTWRDWLQTQGEAKRKPYAMGSKAYPAIADAPGTYVKRRLEFSDLMVAEADAKSEVPAVPSVTS